MVLVLSFDSQSVMGHQVIIFALRFPHRRDETHRMLPACTKGQIGGINASPVRVLLPWGKRDW